MVRYQTLTLSSNAYCGARAINIRRGLSTTDSAAASAMRHSGSDYGVLTIILSLPIWRSNHIKSVVSTKLSGVARLAFISAQRQRITTMTLHCTIIVMKACMWSVRLQYRDSSHQMTSQMSVACSTLSSQYTSLQSIQACMKGPTPEKAMDVKAF